MKRDPELIKKILQTIEEANGLLTASEIKIDDYSTGEVVYHVGLLRDAEYIDGAKMSADDKVDYLISRLTNRGHDFLDAARNETAWRKTKETMAASGGFVLRIAEQLLIDYIKQQL